MPSRALIPVLVGMMLLTGVCNTLLTKYQDQQCVADCDTAHPKNFEQPVLQTLQMFVGEAGCWLVVLMSVLVQRINGSLGRNGRQEQEYEPIPNAEAAEPARTTAAADDDEEEEADEGAGLLSSSSPPRTLVDPTNAVTKPLLDHSAAASARPPMTPLTGWKVTMLALPAICDILGTTCMNVGLLFVAASIYQMTRGVLVLFVGLFSVLFLKRHLSVAKWGSLFIVVLGVAVVGLAGALDKKKPADDVPVEWLPVDGGELLRRARVFIREDLGSITPAQTVLGVFLIGGGQVFTATQFVLEESIMERYSMDPIQVVGWEGTFGFLVTLAAMGVLHAAVGRTPAGQGGYFDARTGFYQMFHDPAIGITSFLIMLSIGGFNFFGLSVTRSISATARSTIDTCRTLFIWVASLGLGWETFKWLQVVGFALLVYGTGVFNDIIQPPTLNFVRRHVRRLTSRNA